MNRAASLAGLCITLATISCGPSPALEPEVPEAEPLPSSPPPTPPPPPSAPPPGAIPADTAQMQSSDGSGEPPPASGELPADAAPPPDQWTVRHPTGQWVYAN